MSDFSQLNLPLPVETDLGATPAPAPESSPDPSLFQALLAEAGYGPGEKLDAPADGVPADVAAELGAEAVDLVPAEEMPARTAIEPGLETEVATGDTEVATADVDARMRIDESRLDAVAGSRPVPISSNEVDAREEAADVEADQPRRRDSGLRVDLERSPVPSPVETTIQGVQVRSESSDRVPDPVNEDTGPATNVSRGETSGFRPDAEVLRADASVVRPDAEVLRADASVVRPDAEVLRADAGVVRPDAETAAFRSESASRRNVIVEETTNVSSFVAKGTGARLEALDLERFDVRRIEFRTESVQPQNTTTNISGKSLSSGVHTLVVEQAVKESPVREPISVRPLTASVEGPVEPRDTRSPVAALDTLDEVPLAPGRQTPRPSQSVLESALAPEADGNVPVAQGRVTSELVWKDLAVSRRDISQSRSTSPSSAVNTSEADQSTPTVGLTAEVPRETNSSNRGSAPQQVAPPKPVMPLSETTFSLDPARRVTMQLGDAESKVLVQIREHQGEVSVRFDAPGQLRTGLETSVQNLIESLGREQVPVSDVLFSSRFDTGTDSRQSHNGHDQRPNSPNHATTESDATLFETEFESSTAGHINVVA